MQTREEKLEYKRQYRLKNKEKIAEYNRTHKEDERRRSRVGTLKKRGLTIKKYDEMFDLQNGRCAICNRHQDELKLRLAVDHDHKTNAIRKLLCNTCNRGIGYLHDNIEILQKAIDYLKLHSL